MIKFSRIVQALYDMTSHKLQQKLFQLVYSHKYVLYNISKVLRNPSGGNYWKVLKSVMAFFSIAAHVKIMDFCMSACLMSTQRVQYYPQSTRNFVLHETWYWVQYSACSKGNSQQIEEICIVKTVKLKVAKCAISEIHVWLFGTVTVL